MLWPKMVAAIGLTLGSAPMASAPPMIVWAWERPEDLRFLPANVEIAVQSGFIELRGDDIITRPRRFPLLARTSQVTTTVVHLQIDHREPLNWTRQLRARTSAAVVRLAQSADVRRVQIDFEVRTSERRALQEVLTDVRAMLPAQTELGMTALASWCATENWTDDLPVDEIAPMLFRMGPVGATIRSHLASGMDFPSVKCRKAMAVSVDAPITRAPTDRRIYLFSPRPWTRDDFDRAVLRINRWRTGDGQTP